MGSPGGPAQPRWQISRRDTSCHAYRFASVPPHSLTLQENSLVSSYFTKILTFVIVATATTRISPRFQPYFQNQLGSVHYLLGTFLHDSDLLRCHSHHGACLTAYLMTSLFYSATTSYAVMRPSTHLDSSSTWWLVYYSHP